MTRFTIISLTSLLLLIGILTLAPSSNRMIDDRLSAKIDKRNDVADVHTLMLQVPNDNDIAYTK